MIKAKILMILLIASTVALLEVNFLYPQNYMQKLLQVEGEKDGDYLGGSVAGVGDINGDGYDDVIIGAPCIFNYELGYVYVLFGEEDMDNIPDLIFHGEAKREVFGRKVAKAGDLNGDGSPDFMINAPGYPEVFDSLYGYWYGLAKGKVNIYLGGIGLDTIPDFSIVGEEEEDLLGAIISPAGNVNGDNYDDIIMSTKINSDNVLDYVFYGDAKMDSVPDWILENGDIGVSNAGDVNGDGYSDVIIAGIKPYAYIFFGNEIMDTIPDVILYEGTSDSTKIRGPIASAGDVNGDGYSDILVGAGAYGPNRKVYIYFGGVNMDSLVDVMMVGDSFYDRAFGSSVACAGDVNGDGYDDVIIGDYDSYGGLGSAHLFLGEATMDSTTDLIIVGHHGAVYLGASVASAGDVNGDGFDDIIVGAPEYWYHQDERGQAIIYAGNSSLTSVKDFEPLIQTPESFILCQNYPNPFNHQTTIKYSLFSLKPAYVKLTIYNLLGKEVRTLVNENQPAGAYEIIWTGKDEHGNRVRCGIYYAMLKNDGFTEIKKMTLIR